MIKAIKHLWDQLPLAKHYTWKIPASAPVAIPANVIGSFDRNIWLKNHLHLKEQPSRISTEDSFWIIQEWGGIKTFKNNPKNQDRMTTFFNQLEKGKLTREIHNLLPSLSKVAAFNYPDRYSIYDSRAIYAMNWLLFCHTKNPALFPQPPGRSKSLIELDSQTLFRLSGRPYTIRSHKSAYFEYCELLKELSRDALSTTQPFYLEMLLFVATESWIPNDIRNRTNVTIK